MFAQESGMDFQKEKEAFEKHASKFFTTNEAFENDGENYVYDEVKFMWDCWLAAKAQAAPKWISAKDNLPPANILVLGMSQARSNIFNVYNVMALDEFEEADVTHWMPLPDAPQEPTND